MPTISHVVVDEVHERDTQTDQLLLLLREMLPTRPDMKVLLMSATVQADLFAKYFDGAGILTSKGRTFPVEEFYLERCLQLTKYRLPADSPCRLRNQGEWQKHSFAVRIISSTAQQGSRAAFPPPAYPPSLRFAAPLTTLPLPFASFRCIIERYTRSGSSRARASILSTLTQGTLNTVRACAIR